MGFGKPLTETPLLFLPGVLGLAWGTAIRMMASGLGIEVDEIVEHWEAEPAPESYDIAAGRIEKGTIAALKFSISGMVAGHPAIVVEHVTRTRDDLRPDWARPAAGGGSYRIEITGEPSYVVDVVPSSAHGDHNHAAIVAACGRIVNAIPDVLRRGTGHPHHARPAAADRARDVRRTRRVVVSAQTTSSESSSSSSPSRLHFSWNSTSSSSSPRSCSIENWARFGTRNRSPAIWMRKESPFSRASARRRSFATTSPVS